MNELKDIKIIYEDNHIIIAEKPINILSQSDKTNDSDMLNMLKAYLKKKYRKLGAVYLGLVHRLDRPVGGVMVFAKTSKAASRISKSIRSMELRKTYYAVVRGKPDLETGKLENYLIKDEKTNIVRVVREGTGESKQAILRYNLIDTKDDLSLMKIRLYTGRPHQIRVQLAYFGHPIYGDQKYGADVNTTGQQLALWSYEICLEHPVKKENLSFSSLPPDVYPWNLFSFE